MPRDGAPPAGGQADGRPKHPSLQVGPAPRLLTPSRTLAANSEHSPARCRVSFCAEAASYIAGPYNQEADDPSPGPDGHGRPVLRYSQSQVQAVRLELRAVVGRCPAWGQINRTPEAPRFEWVRATLLLYEGRQLSIVFEDAGEPVRHIIDFWPLAA